MTKNKSGGGGRGGNLLRILIQGMKVAVPVLLIFFSGAVKGAEVVDRIVAVVDDELVTLSELSEMMHPYEIKIRERGYPLDQEMQMRFKVREEIINQLIDQKITDKEIRRAKIKISENEVDNAIERVKEANAFTDDRLRAMLEAEGLTYETYRKSVRDQLLRTRLINYEVKSRIIVTDEDVKSYYNDHGADFEGKKIEEVSAYISQKLYQKKVEEKFRSWLTNLREQAHIRIIQ